MMKGQGSECCHTDTDAGIGPMGSASMQGHLTHPKDIKRDKMMI